eukprot:10587882-Karenia_brevis.AAC.1
MGPTALMGPTVLIGPIVLIGPTVRMMNDETQNAHGTPNSSLSFSLFPVPGPYSRVAPWCS